MHSLDGPRLRSCQAATLFAATAAVAAAVSGPHASATTAPAPDSARLSIVHGVRGLVADVRMDGKLVLSGFAPERITDPLMVPPGRHRLQVWPAGAAMSTTATVDQTVTLAARQDATAGVGLTATGAPRITLYDDGSLLPRAGSTTLAVRGLAAAPPVRVTVDDGMLGELFSTGQLLGPVNAGSHRLTVSPASGSVPLLAPQEVPVMAGRATVLYLIGARKDDSLGWVAQTVHPQAAAMPNRIATGVGPLPAHDKPAGPGLLLSAALSAPLLSVAVTVALRGRRRRRAATAPL